MEGALVNLRNLFDQLLRQVEVLNDGIEPQFIQLARSFEDCRKKWQRTEQDLGKHKELLMKAETERSSLDVKLKHARNQVDVEIKRRQRAEADCERLERQIHLIRDLLVCEGSNSIQLSEEQRTALAFLNNRSQAQNGYTANKRLSTIDESGSILSDISYDKTEDSLDWDSSLVKTVRLKKREKRRSSRNHTDGPPAPSKRSRSINASADQGNESIVTKTTVTVPGNGGPIEAVATIETVPYWTRSRRRTVLQSWNADSTSENTVGVPEQRQRSNPTELSGGCSTPQSNGGVRLHEFVSKTVIKPESCVPCGKRIKFGKLALKCRDCRVVAHPECRDRCPLPCIPTLGGTPVRIGDGCLADFVSNSAPMIPSIVVHCVNEIEQRGLSETGLYRISGCDRTVKELKEKFVRGKNVPLLSKVEDIHAICGLLKDFLRNLKEPLLTFRLNKIFMQAAEISDEDNSIAAIYQAVSELPQPNRDTLAFLMIHLQRVAQSPHCKMNVSNLSKVFGPTIVAHAVSDPDPMTILQDTKRQPQVVERLLRLPVEYWSQFMIVDQENINQSHIIENSNAFHTPDFKVSMLGPLTTPEHQLSKTPSSSSLSQRVKSTFKTTPKFGSKSKSATSVNRQGNFFASPLLK
ncbi:rac GTPase-activating protein 1 [Latimeria chalumnae]|uniref:Rac GTPase-activating protein 1 n=1 Tax=Latimeria chalumnae TaxID=7897 RepID=H3BEW4_LATCH|nr:PREDICTED: rac GTPase-activating protein 1 isoform X2 [Latimeria chalumnae]XP_014351768.1 PREDICTED: rac GTPase-activating protein 1 isoform X2 [Latimeria chalumnae]|eukprot:XP_014351732.1 PREDICTED: rac GTPase-activating protein 1 isoform X2 [Latimeria chalumnae]